MRSFFIVILLFSLQGTAQITDTLRGLIKDENGKPVNNVSIFLYKVNDTVSIQQAITNDLGVFKMQGISDGNYFITATHVGYVKEKSLNFSVAGNKIPFDTLKIKLLSSLKVMNDVTVTAHKPLIENRIDRTIVNVDAFLNNTGNTLLEVLRNSPNVDVDMNGSINLKGKSGVLVMIDGKQNYLTGSDLTNYLNSIPASQVDQIEIMTQPPAKYDASGNSGVINIKMKKNMLRGFNANISASFMQGVYPRTLNSFVLNYRVNKWNIFTSADVNYVKRFTRRNLSRIITNPANGSNIQYHQDENDISISPDHSILFGVDFSPNKQATLGLVLSNKASQQRDEVTDISSFNDLNNNAKIISLLNGYNVISNPWNNTEIGLSFKHATDKKNDFSADVNYDLYQFRANQQSSNFSLDTSGNLLPMPLNPYIQKAILPSDINIFSAKADDSYSLKNAKIEAGIKLSFIQSKNNSSYYFLENNIFKNDSGLSNNYNYSENINAAYINYHRQLKKWEMQGGLRLEQTNSSGNQMTNNQKFYKSYMQIFPTMYIGFTADKNNTFSLSYGRRIDRPYYSDLNPFLYLVDQYTFRKGNPDLAPYFTNSFELNYNYKGKINASLDYANTSGIIDNIFSQNDSTKILIQSKANLNKLVSMAFNINYNGHIKNWSTIILSYSLWNNHYSGSSNNIAINESKTTYLINYTQQFRFKKGWSAEMNINYRSTFLLTALSIRGPRKITGFAIGKDILKNKANLKLRVSDPFLIQQSYGSTDFSNIHSTTNFKEDSRRIGLTFSYRFQKGIKTNIRKLYSPDEKNRIITN